MGQNSVFIISDTHFFHKNIIQYENRPFQDVEEMNDILIKNWNNIVKKNDKVFHLGDVSFSNKEKTKEIICKLNGYKILIMGNHDKQHPVSWWKETGFNEVYKWPIIYCQWYIFSHEPVYLSETMPYINIHGHTHSKKIESANNSFINVCIEQTQYKPILFKDLMRKL
jgi:calcineurin-like phosphoesterase family protein